MTYSLYLLVTDSKEVAWTEFVQLMTRPVKHVIFPRLENWGVLAYFEDALGQNGTAALVLLLSAATLSMVVILLEWATGSTSKENEDKPAIIPTTRALWTRMQTHLVPALRFSAKSLKDALKKLFL